MTEPRPLSEREIREIKYWSRNHAITSVSMVKMAAVVAVDRLIWLEGQQLFLDLLMARIAGLEKSIARLEVGLSEVLKAAGRA
jgi:hypothetical protein